MLNHYPFLNTILNTVKAANAAMLGSYLLFYTIQNIVNAATTAMLGHYPVIRYHPEYCESYQKQQC